MLSFPASFAQQRLWFLDQLSPGNQFYNVASSLRFTFPLNETALEKSLNEIIRRHEALRTTFASLDGSPVQIIAPELHLPLIIINLRNLPHAEREQETMRMAAEETREP